MLRSIFTKPRVGSSESRKLMSQPYLKILTLVLVLATAIAANPQASQIVRTVAPEEAEREFRHDHEIGDLYRRAVASRFVVVGKVVKREPVADRAWKRPVMDESFAGFLYSIAIEKTVCRQADLSWHTNVADVPPPADADPVVYLLAPVKPPVPGRETLELGQRYLLFLVLPDQKQQKEWTDSLYLDPQKVYLRGEEMARGVVLLPPPDPDHPGVKPPEVLDKVTQLCQAMHPASVPEKLEALYKLAASGDPILSHEAREAMQGLQRPPE
jgi:hypothetical protein